MRTCLLTCHSVPTETDTSPSTALNCELATVTSPNHMTYARRHSYSQQIVRMPWEQVKLGGLLHLKKLLPQFDCVITHGSDVLFMNQRITVDEVCTAAGHTKGVMFAREAHTDWPINNDVGIWLNDEHSMRVIDQLIATWETWRDFPWLWQHQVWNLIQTDKEFAASVTLTNPRMMNASPGGDNEARWKIGDWLCHLLGFEEGNKIPVAKLMLAKCSTDGSYHHPSTTYNRIRRLSQRDLTTVAIAVPNYEGHVRVETSDALIALLMHQSPNLRFLKITATGTQVPRMRDLLVHQARFMVNPYTGKRDVGKILFIDSDMKFVPEQAIRMASHPVSVVGALYPKKKAPYDWCLTPLPGKGLTREGLQQCHEIGTGFKCYYLDVFDAMAEQFPETLYTETLAEFQGQKINMFFHDSVTDGHRNSEDYEVDRKWRVMGGPIHVDTKTQIGHVGWQDFLALKRAKR